MGTPGPGTIPFKIIGQPSLKATLHFILHFTRMPDFNTLDPQGRQADSFQIFIAYDPTTINPLNPQACDVLIRGEEIHVQGDVRVRDARPPVVDPNAGGWGALRGSVPFHLHQLHDGTARMTFDIPFAMLGITGQFAYALETYQFGSTTGSVKGVAP